MKRIILFLSLMVFLSMLIHAQKDTVNVPGFYETSTYGTLNQAIETARTNGTLNNTVFKLKQYELYVLSGTILMQEGEDLEIVADKPGTTQETAPPQIVWTEEDIVNDYIIQTYGNLTIKNVWIRFADLYGNQNACSIAFEDDLGAGDQETGYFEGVIFDYAPIGAEGSGAISVKADHFVGIFKDCYFRNLSDNHYRYYARAVSFPYQSTGFHYDSLLFENCSFTNLGRIVMQEGNEYGDNIHINHCTLFNSMEWVYQSQGYIRNASITNSIFVNPMMFGYRALDVCDVNQDYDDFEDGLCDPPGGGLINGIITVDSLAIDVPFTDMDRKIFIGNNVYMFQDWLLAWYKDCDWCKTNIQQRRPEDNYNPPPMLGEDEIAFMDSMDNEGNKVFKTINVDWSTIYQDEDPGFIVPPINDDTLKLYLEGRWGTGLDIDWSYFPYSGAAQLWPLPENMAYNHAIYQTAAIGDFPLGDLNWFPEQRAAWEAQRESQWTTINNWLQHGNPDGPNSVRGIPGVIPDEYVLDQNYPNPFNPITKIKYSIPVSGDVSLNVYNSLGQLVGIIFNGSQQAGNYEAEFDASGLASGIYIYRLQSGDISLTKKFVLMK